MSQKRAFDLIVTILASVAWVPALLLCVLAIAFKDGRPIFYVSLRRVGNKVIPVIKFRTMMRAAEQACNRDTVPISNNVRFLNTPPDSPYYTPIGRLIERLALTEIPQMLHVLKGDMSLVGNRPLPENVIASLREVIPQVNDRFLTPAGVTGPIQLVGRQDISDGDRLMLEMTYCRVARHRYSWRLDFLILLYTVLVTQGVIPAFTVEQVREFMLRFERVGNPATESTEN
jgi:lipopolysaccharide/colanic/teichoic acid biosynthesis glycosyltransferase